MAYDDDEEAAPPTPGAMNPTLDQFRQQFTDPDARSWANDTATRLDDYAQRKQMADAATAAGDNFVANLDQFKSGLVGMVQNDPFAVDTALSLVRPTVGAMVGNIPGHPPEQLADQHDEISTHIEQTIAGAAVRSMAERHEDTARTMLGKVGGLLDDKDRQALDSYIGVQARARDLDSAAQQRQQVQQQAATEQHTSLGYLDALVHADTGQVQFPPGWAQRVLSDQRVGPQASAQLIDAYGRLWKDGDPPASNPFTAANLLDLSGAGEAKFGDIIQHAGGSLRLPDALAIADLTRPENKQRLDQTTSAIKEAERELANPQNGPAGRLAFTRFVNWLLPQVQDGAVLDPESPDYLLAGHRTAAFAPRVADNIDAVPQATRRPIGEYFGR